MAILARARASGFGRFATAALVVSIVSAACAPASSPGGPGVPGSAAVGPGSRPPATSVAVAPTCAPIAPVAASPWWVHTTFYEVFVRSFADSNGDGIGDLDGLTAHLDYLRDLGIGGIWLMPVAESPSYHGYDVTDYTKVQPAYGGAAAFQRLIAAAHARRIRVVVDFEANHTSDEHPWFLDALRNGPHHDWYVWSADDPGWPNPIGAGDPWHPSSAGYYYGVFSPSMPDLNLRNANATAALDAAARYWLDDLGADGLRIDAARHLIEDGPNAQVNTPETHAWLAAFRSTVHAARPDALVLGEVYDAELTSAGYAKDGSLDMSFDFEIGPAIANALAHGDGGSLSASEAGAAQAFPPGSAAVFLSNHDQTRIMTTLRGDQPTAAQAAATLLTLPGTPFVYYGEELGMTGDKPDERIRTPFPWTAEPSRHGFTTGTPWEPFGDGANTANVASEASDASSLLATYRRLIAVRNANPALADGTFTPLATSDPHVVATLRSDSSERLVVLQNVGTDPVVRPSLTLASGALCGAGSTVLYASTSVGPVAEPAITSEGGLAGWVPLEALPGRSTVVIAVGS